MTAPQTPYTNALEGQDPIAAMRDTIDRVRALAAGWSPSDFERPYAPGKWTIRQILMHLIQTDLALSTRARMALATPGYTSQNFDQDAWMANEAPLAAADAVEVFLALARMNVAFYAGLSEAQRHAPFTHPEYGSISVDWVLHQQSGHQRHHLVQLEAFRASR